MAKTDYFVFVCGQQRPAGHPRSSCGEKGSGNLLNAFSSQLIARNLLPKVSLVATGCLGPCQAGPNVLIFPGAHLYIGVLPEDLDEIIEKHLIGGTPIEERLAPAELW